MVSETAITSATNKIGLESMLELLFLAALWGASFLLLRITSPVFGPILLIELRVLIGLAVMLPFLFLYKQHGELLNHWRLIAFVGFINMGLPFTMLAYASLNLGAGVISILNATVPFFAAISGFLLFSERLSWPSIAGLFIGFIGVVILIVGNGNSLDLGVSALAFAAGLGAACLYGYSTNLINQKLIGVSGLAITVGSLFFSAVYLLPFTLLEQPRSTPSASDWIGVALLGSLCTGLAFILFFRLLKRIGPNRTVTVTYLVPVFSIFYGMLFLGESVTAAMVVGCVLVLSGVAITTGALTGLIRSLGSG